MRIKSVKPRHTRLLNENALLSPHQDNLSINICRVAIQGLKWLWRLIRAFHALGKIKNFFLQTVLQDTKIIHTFSYFKHNFSSLNKLSKVRQKKVISGWLNKFSSAHLLRLACTKFQRKRVQKKMSKSASVQTIAHLLTPNNYNGSSEIMLTGWLTNFQVKHI